MAPVDVGNEKETEPVWRAGEDASQTQGQKIKVEAGVSKGKVLEIATQVTRVSWKSGYKLSGTQVGTLVWNKHCPARGRHSKAGGEKFY